jgi:hypothetical protein
VISPHKDLYLHRTTQGRNTWANIHALSGIRTHVLSDQGIMAYTSDRAATGTSHVDQWSPTFFFTHPYISNNNYHAPRNLSLYIYLLVFIYKLNIPLVLGLRDLFSYRVSSGSIIVSDYGLDDRAIGVRFSAKAKDFFSILCVQTGSVAHPASSTMGTGGPFLGGKARPGCDADHSSPSRAEVVNE